jgi:tRNA(Ile)-lysidine synthetase-like protein
MTNFISNTYILNELKELREYWFRNPNLWFNCSEKEDELIKKKYYNLLLNEVDNKDSSLSLIILYDQISRHIFRNQPAQIKYYSDIALKHMYNILPFIENYKPEEKCFILLPLRHTFIKSNIEICLLYVNKWLETDNKNKLVNEPVDSTAIYNRFYQATISSLVKINSNDETLTLEKNETLYNNYEPILDPTSIKDITFSENSNIYTNPIYIEFAMNLNNTTNDLLVSISGGVDSMVCSLLLYYYVKEHKIKAKAVTINYSNRPEQKLEIEMVNDWLKLLNIEYHVKNITEITRPRDKNRDFYEKITRDIRFDTYKKVGGDVILGHNKDDSLENIFSNIKKKKSYENLLGMSIYGTEKDVNIIRPLLNVSKKEIINFAQEYNIPYVYDSTPAWSERGKMRDILIPQITDFDEDILEGLIELSNNYKEIYKIYKSQCVPKITFLEKECYFDNPDTYFFDYWQNILLTICKHYKCGMVRNKSVHHLINMLKTESNITLSNNLTCRLKNGIVKIIKN